MDELLKDRKADLFFWFLVIVALVAMIGPIIVGDINGSNSISGYSSACNIGALNSNQCGIKLGSTVLRAAQ